jgi:threonine synthase
MWLRRLRIAANINDILARTLKTGIYEVREVHATTSPSMDIQISSNFERLLFEATGRDSAAVRTLMASLAQSGRFVLPDAALANIRAEFVRTSMRTRRPCSGLRPARRSGS